MTIHRLLLLVAALMIAGATAFGAKTWVAAERNQARAVQVKPKAQAAVRVLVAAEAMAPGAFVKPKHLQWRAWPEDGVAEGYTVAKAGAEDKAKTGFAGSVVRMRIAPGQPVTAAQLVQPGERGFMAAVLSPGNRAVSVPVNATSGIAGFVFPGDRVDLVLTFALPMDKGEGRRRQASQTLLDNLRVLAIDQTVENTDGKASVAKTATLEVTPKQAEKIALALQLGSLSLSLRSLAGTETKASAENTKVKSDPRVTMDHDVMYLTAKTKSAPKKTSVLVVRGNKAEKAAF